MQYKILTSRNFTEQYVYRDDDKIATINNPTDSLDIRSIHVMRQSKALTGQNKNIRLLQGYDHTIVPVPGKENRNPQATFEHYMVAETLKSIIETDNNAKRKTYIDMGCGAGFIGNHIGKRVGKIIFTDLFPEALEDAIQACILNNGLTIGAKPEEIPDGVRFKSDQGTYYDFKLGDIAQTLQQVPFHTATACPVYIPYICEVFPQAYELFAKVTKNGIKENSTGTSEIYFGHSSLSTHKIQEAAEKTGGEITEIRSKKMPLDISIVDSVTNEHNIPVGNLLEALIPYGIEIENQEAYHKLVVTKISFKA